MSPVGTRSAWYFRKFEAIGCSVALLASSTLSPGLEACTCVCRSLAIDATDAADSGDDMSRHGGSVAKLKSKR
jgi:hypothetical protein